MNPSPLPTTPRIEDWERLRADMIADEMQPTAENPRGLTPSEAATHANARCRDAFVAMFPGKAMPINPAQATASARTEPLPGGMKTKDGRTWFPIARVEDDRSSFKPAERLSSRELADMAASYDPQTQHRAPVITPQGGPAHLTGEYATADAGVAGHVDAVDFDGHMLWGLVSQIDGGIDKAVAKGLETRSIGSWVARKEADGRPYLRHLAITAEPAGTHNLGDIRKYYPGVSSTTRTTSDGEMRFRTLADLPELDQQRSRTMPEGVKTPSQEAALEIDYDAIATRVAAKLGAAAKPATQAAAPDFEAMISRAVSAATDPLKSQITGLEASVARSAKAAEASALEARTTRVRTVLDEGIRAGRLVPGEVPSLESILLMPELPEAKVTELLDGISKRAVVALARTRPSLEVAEGVTVQMPTEFLNGSGEVADPQGAEIVLRARTVAAKESDPVKAYQILEREILRAHGEAN